MLFPQVDLTSQSNVSAYIQDIIQEEQNLSRERVHTVLSAAVLRCLGGLTTVQFVLDLYHEVNNNIDMTKDPELLEVSLLLTHLEHQVSCKNSSELAIQTKLRMILAMLLHRHD